MVGVDTGNVMRQVGVRFFPNYINVCNNLQYVCSKQQGTDIKSPFFRVYYPNCMPIQAGMI